MTVFFLWLSENVACVDVGKSEDHFLFFLVIHKKWFMKSFSVKMDAFQENLQRAPKFFLIFTALLDTSRLTKILEGTLVKTMTFISQHNLNLVNKNNCIFMPIIAVFFCQIMS